MRMGFDEAVRAHVPVHIEVGDHPPIDKLGLHEVPGEGDALGLVHLPRNGELDLARQLGVLADLSGLDLIPQPLAIRPFFRRAVRQHHLGMDDA